MSLFNNFSSPPSTLFPNNNNNSNQPNLNNQTGIFPAPQNLPNNSFGSMPPQLTFGSTSGGGGGLLGNPQPSGGIFGNQIQQQSQTGGGLFGGQVQQQPQTGGLFGNQVQQQHQTGGLLGNPQPSGGLFGNQIQQQPPSGGLFGGQAQQAQGGGGLFSNQVQQQPQTGGLFGGPQPSGGLFGNQIQQQPPSGGLFGVQAQQAQGGGGLFGNAMQQAGLVIPSQPYVRIDFSSNGTVDLIGRHYINNYPRNKENISLPSITNRNEFRGHTLDEIRMKDYFNLKNNTLNSAQKSTVCTIINNNLSQIGGIGPRTVHSHFSSTGLPPNLATLFGDTTLHPQLVGNSIHPAQTSGGLIMNPQPSQITPPSLQNTQSTTLFGGNTTQAVPASGSLFMNPQPSQIIPSPMVTNQPSDLQSSSSLPTQTPTVSQAKTKPSVIKSVRQTAAKSEKKTMLSNPGSFNYEFNKMLFVSGLIQIMEKHNMKVPENLLDNTDFAPQLLAFLEQHNISLPAENIPQFQISSVAPLESENNFGEENNDEEYNNYC